MQINVVKDKSGKVLATFQSGSGNGAQAKPISSAGHKVEQLEVPENYRSNLGTIYK